MDEIVVNDIGMNKLVGYNYLTYAINQTYSLSDNSQFYAFINPSYYDYYWRIVRINLQWYDGFVSGLHNLENGISSTRIATTLVNGMAKQVLGSSILFKSSSENGNEAVKFFSNIWQKKSNIKNAINLATKYAFASGTSALVINYSIKDLWLEACRQDYFYCETDFKGNVVDFVRYIKGYLNINGLSGEDSAKKENYFLVEHRYFGNFETFEKLSYVDDKGIENHRKVKIVEKNVPLIEYQVYHYTGQMLTSKNMVRNVQKGLEWNDIPRALKRSIKKDYASLVVNKPFRLPFVKNIGVELIKYDLDGSVPAGQFGTGVLTNIRSDLIDYEIAHAYMVRDMYNGQGQVGIPKTLTTGKLSGLTNIYDENKMNYQTYDGDPNSQKPIINQFELRGVEWGVIFDRIFRNMATKLNTSPKIISSYLGVNGLGQKTATETNSDDDSVISFISEARSEIEEPINKILGVVSLFYGYDSVEIKFANSGIYNKDNAVDRAIKLYDEGFIDMREALKDIYPDDTEAQIDDKLSKAQARQNELKPNEIDGLGNFNE